MLNIQARCAGFVKEWPRLFDFSKSILRRFKKNRIYCLLAGFEKSRGKIIFLQIGSNDGISNDPLREFIVKGNRWEGCCVEPLPHIFLQLEKNYRYARRATLKFRNAAVSDSTGQMNFYRVKDRFHHDCPGYPDQISSFSIDHVLKHFPAHLRSADKIESIPVEVLSPTALLQQLGYARVDVLHLDVEGHEKKILDAYPFEKFRPEIIIFESVHLAKQDLTQIIKRLKEFDFEIEECGMDTLAIQRGIV